MALSNEVFLFGLEFVIYLILGLTWNFSLFGTKNSEENKNSAVRLLFIWLLIWLMPLMTQYALEIAGDLSRSADQITLITTLYNVNIIIAIVISFILAIYFIMNVMTYLSRSMKK